MILVLPAPVHKDKFVVGSSFNFTISKAFC